MSTFQKRNILIAIAFLLTMAGIFFFSTHKASSDRSLPSISQAEEFWAEEIKKNGGARAYKILSEKLANETEPQKHLQAHAFGAALYAVEGIKGLSVCEGGLYGYGCFHQFFGHAIVDLGTGSIRELNEVCIDDSGATKLACQHSVGHGIQAALGYERSDLWQALALCKDLPHKIGAVGGCYGGVFMEYNVRTVLGPDASPREPGNNLADPCDALDAPYSETCVYWLPHWWWTTVFSEKSNRSTFSSLGEYCDVHIHSEELRKICYNGIGLITPKATAYDPHRTKEFCFAVSENTENKLTCLSNAVNIIGMTLNPETAARACEDLATSAKKYCEAYAYNEGNLARVLDVPHDQ